MLKSFFYLVMKLQIWIIHAEALGVYGACVPIAHLCGE